MKKNLILFTLALFASCAGTQSGDNSGTIKTGWIDEDTYTVMVIEKNLEKAVDQAKHQILKDIVNVRVSNRSRYIDVIKIRDEFEMPLKNGRIISKKNLPDRIQIYFQIRDEGLKKKFQRL